MKTLQKKAFTLIELLVVISIIALLIGILLPALGAARRTANQMKSSTQVRGIMQGCILFAQGNGTYYPGLQSDGSVTPQANIANTAGGVNGDQPIGRYALLLNGNYFTGEYAISPVESDAAVKAYKSGSGNVTVINYSYSMLKIIGTNATTPGPDAGRRNEWKETTNTTAVVMSDRKVANGSGFKSNWTSPAANATDWRGTVGWNDNHVTFETSTAISNTKYTGGTNVASDDLFTDEVTSPLGSNALMVYTDGSTN